MLEKLFEKFLWMHCYLSQRHFKGSAWLLLTHTGVFTYVFWLDCVGMQRLCLIDSSLHLLLFSAAIGGQLTLYSLRQKPCTNPVYLTFTILYSRVCSNPVIQNKAPSNSQLIIGLIFQSDCKHLNECAGPLNILTMLLELVLKVASLWRCKTS